MKKSIILFALISITLIGCKVFKGGKQLTQLSFEYNQNANVNYGSVFPIKVLANYSNGKTKDITSKSDLTINISGAKYQKGKVYCNRYPKNFEKDTIKIDATYRKDDKEYKQSLIIPFNYKGKVDLFFNGQKGANGATGSKGGVTLLFRNGKEGGAGDDGLDGERGHDITTFIWSEGELYFIKVYDMTDDVSYFFKANSNTLAYNINAIGGQGGDGGKGGNGGDGRDGKKTEKKTKLPGDGGNGGVGGNGGNGGVGGNIYIFIHPNAANFKSKIYTNNSGGQAGKAGKGGRAGKGGTPLEGQSATTDGVAGANGNPGLFGANGDVINIEIQEFDIEDVKNN